MIKSEGVLTITSLLFEMPETGGLEVKLKAKKPPGKSSTERTDWLPLRLIDYCLSRNSNFFCKNSNHNKI